MTDTKKIILTGAMGAGKSTIINALRKRHIHCIDEPARQILKEQRSIEGNGVPEQDAKLFTELLLSRSLHLYNESNDNPFAIYDRGIPDCIAYARLFGLKEDHYWHAAKQYRYEKKVYILPSWPEIYSTDDERKMSVEQAADFGDEIYSIYKELGYDMITVPKLSIEARLKFIIDQL